MRWRRENSILLRILPLICELLASVSRSLASPENREEAVEGGQEELVGSLVGEEFKVGVFKPQGRYEELPRHHTAPFPIEHGNNAHVLVDEQIERLQIAMDKNKRALVEARSIQSSAYSRKMWR